MNHCCTQKHQHSTRIYQRSQVHVHGTIYIERKHGWNQSIINLRERLITGAAGDAVNILLLDSRRGYTSVFALWKPTTLCTYDLCDFVYAWQTSVKKYSKQLNVSRLKLKLRLSFWGMYHFHSPRAKKVYLDIDCLWLSRNTKN